MTFPSLDAIPFDLRTLRALSVTSRHLVGGAIWIIALGFDEGVETLRVGDADAMEQLVATIIARAGGSLSPSPRAAAAAAL